MVPRGILKERFPSFDELLKFVLIQSDDGPSVESMAIALGTARMTLYSYCSGHRQFPIDLLGPLTSRSDDPRFLKYFTEQAGYLLVKAPVAGSAPSVSVFREMIEAQKKAVELSEKVLAAIEDGHVCHDDCARIREAVRVAMTELAELDAVVVMAARRKS